MTAEFEPAEEILLWLRGYDLDENDREFLKESWYQAFKPQPLNPSLKPN